jgi:hypothetical protein
MYFSGGVKKETWEPLVCKTDWRTCIAPAVTSWSWNKVRSCNRSVISFLYVQQIHWPNRDSISSRQNSSAFRRWTVTHTRTWGNLLRQTWRWQQNDYFLFVSFFLNPLTGVLGKLISRSIGQSLKPEDLMQRVLSWSSSVQSKPSYLILILSFCFCLLLPKNIFISHGLFYDGAGI